jgi:phospholipase C
LRLGASIALLAALVSPAAQSSIANANSPSASPKHIFVIMLENHSRSSVLGDPNAPYINALANEFAVAERYYGVTHPSEPNYVAAISGSNWFVNDDNPANRYDHTNLVDQLEAHHKSWAAYMEAMPSVGYLGD